MMNSSTKSISKVLWKVLKVPHTEFNLENTLVNGQCFNWKKLDKDHYEGIFNRFYVQLKRTSPEEL